MMLQTDDHAAFFEWLRVLINKKIKDRLPMDIKSNHNLLNEEITVQINPDNESWDVITLVISENGRYTVNGSSVQQNTDSRSLFSTIKHYNDRQTDQHLNDFLSKYLTN